MNLEHSRTEKDIAFGEIMEGMIGMLIAMIIFPLLLGGHESIRGSSLWIQPWYGGKKYKLPFYQALRIVRKHNWRLVETRPNVTIRERFSQAKMNIIGPTVRLVSRRGK